MRIYHLADECHVGFLEQIHTHINILTPCSSMLGGFLGEPLSLTAVRPSRRWCATPNGKLQDCFLLLQITILRFLQSLCE